MKIIIAGTGYVGLSNAILLSQHNEVIAVDLVPDQQQEVPYCGSGDFRILG